MARRSQCSSAGDNPLDPNYLPPHYREEYRLAVDALVEEDLDGYYQFLQKADVVDFLCPPEIQYIQSSVQVPQQSNYSEQCFLDTGEDGSSDTYWPIHSDLDAPGLDLGWPQLHHFIGPTEVTTLVNPPEPDMPSIKEQARRLIKNAKQVIAIVMDMFTDVDMLADILDAAMRNVAVYILLDKQNALHFVNMVSNCRVNIQSIQFLRVRTVSGITYHCRSGKSFKGQMMDRFLLTDCRAVLSGNYSFMWSFEKLHRCMAHLFLGQLVSTFDEEFRILFAQSQPLMIENVPASMEDFSLLQERQFPSEITSLYREPRTFLSVDTIHPEEWPRHSYDDCMDVDWRMMPHKRQESGYGPADTYSRYPSQQSRMDPCFDQGPSRTPMMENPAFKRHSHSYPFLQQQGMPEHENQGRQFHRGQQPYPTPGKEADYSRYDQFWNQDYHSVDPYPEPGLPQKTEPPFNFDPVLNYLSSTRNVDFDESSEKLPPAADLPISSSHPKRLSLGQPYACQTSPTPSNPSDQKQFFQEPNTDRKDPIVKQGLRNWRISSYLSAYDNPGDEGLPVTPPNAPDPLEEPSNLIQQTAPGTDLSVPKIPNVREFKVPAILRVSQIPSYAKTTAREQTKKLPEEPSAVTTETKTAPTPSESSSTAEGEKTEEAEQKEPKTAVVKRDGSFRRNYNAAVQRSSRLRSSLIFSSLEQQHNFQDTQTASGQQEEESDKNEAEQTKLPFVFQVLGQRKSMAREPYEWSRYMKSASFDNSAADSTKPDDGNIKADDKDSSKDENSKDLLENHEVQESLKPPDVEQKHSSPSVPQSKPSEAELPKTDQPAQPPKSLLTNPLYVDMSDPDRRLMFFKELAAQRKSAKATEAVKSKDKAPMKPPTELKIKTAVKKMEPVPKETSEKMTKTSKSEGLSERNAAAEKAGKPESTEACMSVSLSLDGSDKTNKEDSQVKNDPNTSQSYKNEQTRVSTHSEKIELKNSQSAAMPVSAETQAPQSEPPEEPKLSNPAVIKSSPSHPTTTTNATSGNVLSLAQGTDENEIPCLDSTSRHSSSLTPGSVEVAPSSAFAALDSNTPNLELVHLETSISSSPQLSEQHSGSEFSSSHPSVQSSSSDHILPDSGSQISPCPSPSSSAPLSTPAETISSNVTPEDSSTGSSTEPSQSFEETAQKSTASSISQTESTQAHLKSVSRLTSSETPSAADSAANITPEDSNSTITSSILSPNVQDSGSLSLPEPAQSFEETAQKSTASSISQTESTQAHLESVSRLTSSETPSAADSASDVTPGDTIATLSSSILSPNVHDSFSFSTPQPAQSFEDTAQKSAASSISQFTPSETPSAPYSASNVTPEDSSTGSSISQTESTQGHLDSVSQLMSSGTPSAADSASDVTPGDSISTLTSSILSTNVQDSVIFSTPQPAQSFEETAQKAAASSVSQTESTKAHLESVSQLSPSETPSAAFSASNVTPEDSSLESFEETTQKYTASSISQADLQSVSQLKSSKTPPAADSANVESDISPDTYAAGLLQSTTKSDSEESCAPTPSEKDVPKSENKFIPKDVGEESEVLGSLKGVKADSTPPNLSPSLTESPNVSNLEIKSRTDQNEITTTTPSPADPPPEHSPAETSHPVNPDFTPNASQSETTASPQDAPIQATPPSEPNLTTPAAAETVSCSPLNESVGSVMSPEAEKTMSAFYRPSDTNSLPKQVTTDSNETPMLPSTKTSSPTEPTSKDPIESDLPCKIPESEASETHHSESVVSAENSKMDSQNEVNNEPDIPDPGEKKIDDTEATNEDNNPSTLELVCSEKTHDQVRQNKYSKLPGLTSDEGVAPSPQSKQPKSSQSRYHSSTANVLSSSNLRDDTKLLLEQISANSQSRNEATKASPVTDDEKEDKADKNAKREKERGIRSLSRGQPKSNQEREKLLERIQSMRKERKVYSRFEMAP